MINYVLKSPDTSKAFSLEGVLSAGSYNLLSTFISIGGKSGKLEYYGYYHKRTSDGYRKNSHSSAQGQYGGIKYHFSKDLNLKFEIGRSQYRYQIPGPLTDSMFYADPRQSTRSRNFFSPDIYIPALSLSWKLNNAASLHWNLSGVFGARNSVEFEGFADKKDLIDPATLEYKPRTVNIDKFHSKTSELRFLQHYHIGKFKNILSAGLAGFHNSMDRMQQGKGTTGTDYDISVTGEWGRDLTYKTRSVSFNLENLFYITPQLSVSPGFRFEYGKTDMAGTISYLDPQDIPNRINHTIPLL